MHSFQTTFIPVAAFFTFLIGMTTAGCDRGTPINIGSDPCDVSACGAAPEAKYTTCTDGTQAGPTGQCLKTSDGSCAWEYSTCAAACSTGDTRTADDGCNQCTCTKSGVWDCATLACVNPAGCVEADCGAKPQSVPTTCSDGSIGGHTGQCLRDANGTCSWEYRTCPDPKACSDAECGDIPQSVADVCEDGSIGGYTGQCLRNASGTCGWEFRICPDSNTCLNAECGEIPQSVAVLCDDGSKGGYTGQCLRNTSGKCAWEYRECPTTCTYEGKSYSFGSTFPSIDGCNTCSCKDGKVVCTTNVCPDPKPCTDAECGSRPKCATYQCEDGSMAGCTDQCLRDANGICGWEIRSCPVTCDYNGKSYTTGSSFPSGDGCNTCSCDGGNVVCTKNVCPDPKPCEDAECDGKPKPDCGTNQCADGSVAGCTNKCLRDTNGVCSWEVRQCPTACKTLGEVVILDDSCQQCTCTVDGNWTCKDADPGECKGICTYGDANYASGQVRPAEDGCSTCTCANDGTWACTEKIDPSLCNTSCNYQGAIYTSGSSFSSSDGCCTCIGGKVSCSLTAMACNVSCVYDGKVYGTGDGYTAVNGCDSCTCNNGINICTNTASCAGSYVCDIGECKGDMPSGAAFQCPDGSLGGVTGRCLRDVTSASGACSWEVRKCSVDCKPGDQTLTADGCGTCVCGADLGWTCSEGKCEVCPEGDPRFIEGGCPTCTVGMDQTCNDEPMNSLAGSCIRNVCKCNDGFGLNPKNGKCKVSTATANSTCIPNFNTYGDCNGNPQVSYLEGKCLFDGTCHCLDSHVIDAATGKCVPPLR